jgi:hypothetical protein
MRIKRYAAGLAAVVALAASGFGGTGATAETGGHFVSAASHTKIVGSEVEGHRLHFAVDGGTSIACLNASYAGTLTSATATEISLSPSWLECHTTAPESQTFRIEDLGCTLVLTVGKSPAAHNTGHVKCPEGTLGIDLRHPNCTIRIPPQTVNGLAYLKPEATPDLITLNSTVTSMQMQHEGGVCIFLGTNHTGTMTGSVTLSGYDAGGTQVGLTATG